MFPERYDVGKSEYVDNTILGRFEDLAAIGVNCAYNVWCKAEDVYGSITGYGCDIVESALDYLDRYLPLSD